MQQDELILRRVEAPGKQDTSPYGTKCIVIEFGQQVAIYIQTSQDENDPRWNKYEQEETNGRI